MNVLPKAKRIEILHLLVEGMGMRSVNRVSHVAFNTIQRILLEAGDVCLQYHDKHVRNIQATRVQADELWAFTYAKEKNLGRAIAPPKRAGDVWTWKAVDADSKLVISWLVGERSPECALDFMDDLRSRLANRIQLSTDGLGVYREAVEGAFGGYVDFAQLVKIYSPKPEADPKQAISGHCVGARKEPVVGNPRIEHVSTSYVERSNLTLRHLTKRYARQTISFSRKFENHCAAVALYMFYFNFCKLHTTLKATPAMAAGLASRPLTLEVIVDQIEAQRPPAKRGPYKKRAKGKHRKAKQP